jgi:hypothetical protein
MSVIRFKTINRYRKSIGDLDDQLTYGIHDTLVMRGIAEWVDQSPTGAIAKPEVSEEAPRERRPRRFHPKES